MNFALIVTALMVLVSMFVIEYVAHSDPKEACLHAGGTAVEQPAGTFIKCLR